MWHRRQLLPVVAWLFVGCAGSPTVTAAAAPATDPDPLGAALLLELQAEDGAVAPAALASLAPADRLSRALAAIALDETAPALARNRALVALGQFPSVAGNAALDRVARTGQSAYARRLATRAQRGP